MTVRQLACQAKYPDLIMNVRGMGGFCAVDARDAETRDRIITKMRGRGRLSCMMPHTLCMVHLFPASLSCASTSPTGVHCGGSGQRTIRLRPALVFQPKHVDVYLDALNGVLSSF